MSDTTAGAIPSDYKPGLEGVTAGLSAISEVDAEQNRLIYRGYDIHDLVEKCTMDEVAYLLLHGDLPTEGQYADFKKRLAEQRDVPDAVWNLFHAMPTDAHPMDRLKAAVALLATLDPENDDNSRDANLRKAERLYARMPALVAVGWRISQGYEGVPTPPGPDLDHNAHFFHLLTGEIPSDFFLRLLNVTQILYAEHGYNASTFAARVTVSTLADLYSGVVSAIGTLKGPLHGGANEAAMEMLMEIETPEKAADYIRDALAKKKKIMGFGHREYKHGDERAKIVKEFANELAAQTGETKWRDISQIVEDEMLKAKSLYPNLDFPVASAYYLMGLPIPLYTPIFVMSRITGWAAHIIEQLDNNRIIRPQHVYTGPRERKVVPRGERGVASS
jgi:2-methylcitrate synthase/citrate synthase II